MAKAVKNIFCGPKFTFSPSRIVSISSIILLDKDRKKTRIPAQLFFQDCNAFLYALASHSAVFSCGINRWPFFAALCLDVQKTKQSNRTFRISAERFAVLRQLRLRYAITKIKSIQIKALAKIFFKYKS